MKEDRTIRDYINYRGRWAQLALISFAITFILSRYFEEFTMWILIFLSSVGFVISAAVSAYMVRCPHCRGSLLRLTGTIGSLANDGKHKMKFCPYCGVSLDERIIA